MTEGISPEDQAELDRRVVAVDAALDGAAINVCLSVLSAVAAHICANDCDNPNEAGMSFVGEFIDYLNDRIAEIPAERVIDIPNPPETN